MKKIIISLLMSALSTTLSFGQFQQMFPTTSGNQRMVEQSLKDAVCILRMEFQLEDTVSHERYNTEGNSFFDFSEGLCIKTEKGWIAPVSTVNPWNNSENAQKYPEYKPVLSSASCLAVHDSTWRAMDIPTLTALEVIDDTPFAIVSDSLTFTEGLTIGAVDDSTEGWLVWVCRNGNQVWVRTYSHHLAVSDSTSISVGQKVVPDNAIGGFFVSPTFPSLGTIQFKLMGLLDNSKGEWGIVVLEESEKEVVLTPDKPKLVPAGEKEINGKNEAPVKEKRNRKNKK